MLVGNYEEMREVKAIKPASAVMFTVELGFSYLSLAALRVFCSTQEKQSVERGSLSVPSSDLFL